METKISEVIEDFQKHCRLTKAEQTVKYQKYQFGPMLTFFNDHGISFLSQINRSVLDDMIIQFKKTCKNISINKRLLLLKMLYQYLDIPFDYLKSFPKLRQEQNRYNAIPESDLRRILNYVNKYDENNPYEMTRKLIVLLLLDTGARQSELLKIQINNISFEERKILLTSTKTKIAREVFFSKMTFDLMLRYSQLKPKRKYLFYNFLKDRPFTERDLRAFMDKMKFDLGIIKLTSRNFRHTTATVLVDNGCPLETVQAILGHKNLMTTQIYLHLSVKKHQNDFNKFSMLNNIETQKAA
jgi:site-specific recombinase XerD